ncbi:MAG: hypothetical protein R2817_07755 [Flavobacteriales bacterium]
MLFTLIAAIAIIALRLVLFNMGLPAEGTDFMLVHFLAIVTVVYFADARLLRAEPRSGFPDLLREGFRQAALYAVLMLGFLWFYYTQVEDSLFQERIDERVAMAVVEGQPEALVRERMERFFTPFNYATITFFALLAVGAVQTFVIGLLHHKVMRRYAQR